MAYAGQVIENPASGERLTWHVTSADSDGAFLRMEFHVRPGGAVPLKHIHRRAEERFEMLSGTVVVDIDGERRELGAGETAVVPAGVPHRWWNSGEDEARFMVEIEPAWKAEELMETMFGLGRDGATGRGGMPSLLQIAVMQDEFGDEAAAPFPPRWIQRALFAVLAPIGRARGLKPTYDHHHAASPSPRASAAAVTA